MVCIECGVLDERWAVDGLWTVGAVCIECAVLGERWTIDERLAGLVGGGRRWLFSGRRRMVIWMWWAVAIH